MKILLIITDYGSFNNFISEVAVRLKNIGHDVHVICSKEKLIIKINFHIQIWASSFITKISPGLSISYHK
jgi:hypothetical protein